MLRNPGLRKSVEQPVLDLNFAASQIGSNGAPDARIDFSRGTNAWFVDSDGLVKKSPHNLITNSDNVLARFSNQNSTETNDQTISPDGTLNGDLLVPDTSNASHTSFISTLSISASTSYAYSMFVKANGYNFVQLTFTGGFGNNDVWANFNLSTGATASKGSAATSSIEDYGNGWFRCVVIGTTGASATTGGPAFAAIGSDTASRDPSFAGDGTSGIFVWGAQLSEHTTLPVDNPYIATSSSSAVYAARLDHDPTWFMSAAQEQNLLQYSEAINDSYWTKTRTTVTANALEAPDGTVTAELLSEDTSSSNTHILRQSNPADVPQTAGKSYVFSGYLKAGGRHRARIRFESSAHQAHVNLIDGTINNLGMDSVSLTDEGNGWFRFAGVQTADATNDPLIQIMLIADDGSTNYTGDGSSGLYVWGLQLEVGTSPSTYHRTEGAPYYGEGATPKGLLIEEQRANLVSYSEDFSASGLAPSQSPGGSVTLTHNNALAPDGTTTATKLVATSSGGNTGHLLFKSVGVSNNTTATASVFMKNAGQRWAYLQLANTGYVSTKNAYVDLENGVLGTSDSSATIEDYGNGWYRVSVTNTTDSDGGNDVVGIGLAEGDVDPIFTGDDTNGIYIWGLQKEVGSFPTSYIKNTGTGATRNADVATMGPTTGGTELVTNGTFDTDASNWFFTNATLSSESGKLRVTSTGGSFAQANQLLSTVVGRRYRLTADVDFGTSASANVQINAESDGSFTASEAFTADGSASIDFTAQTTTPRVIVHIGASSSAGEYQEFDNISVRELYPFEAYNPAEGTVVCEAKRFGTGAFERIWEMGTSATTEAMAVLSLGNLQIYFGHQANGSGELTFNVIRALIGETNITAYAYQQDNYHVSSVTEEVEKSFTDTSISVADVDRLGIGCRPRDFSGAGNNHIKRLTYYPYRLNDDVCDSKVTS